MFTIDKILPDHTAYIEESAIHDIFEILDVLKSIEISEYTQQKIKSFFIDFFIKHSLKVLELVDEHGAQPVERIFNSPVLLKIFYEANQIMVLKKEKTSERGFKIFGNNAYNANVIVAGHRGDGANTVAATRSISRTSFPENTLSSFRHVLAQNIPAIEFDLYLSRDNYLMVIHDNDLSINCKYIYGFDLTEQESTLRGKSFFINPNQNFVSGLDKFFLQQRFDVSHDISSHDDEFRKIPTFLELLTLIIEDNARRHKEGISPVIVNAELKGINTGMVIMWEIARANEIIAPSKNLAPIPLEHFHFLSFYEKELMSVAACYSAAKLILGIGTKYHYTKVDEIFRIEDDAEFNEDCLNSLFLGTNEQLLKITRGETKLSGVDIPLLDISDSTIRYFCEKHDTPIHISITPYAKEELLGYKLASLMNVNKILKMQYECLSDKSQTIIIKTDEFDIVNKFLKKDILFIEEPETVEVSLPRLYKYSVLKPNKRRPTVALSDLAVFNEVDEPARRKRCIS